MIQTTSTKSVTDGDFMYVTNASVDFTAKFSCQTVREKWKHIHTYPSKKDNTQDTRDTVDLLIDYVTAEAANHSRTGDNVPNVISGEGSLGEKREPWTATVDVVIRRKQKNRTPQAQV